MRIYISSIDVEINHLVLESYGGISWRTGAWSSAQWERTGLRAVLLWLLYSSIRKHTQLGWKLN